MYAVPPTTQDRNQRKWTSTWKMFEVNRKKITGYLETGPLVYGIKVSREKFFTYSPIS